MENWYRDDNNGIRIGKDKEFLRVLCGASEKTYADTLPNRIKVLREIQRIQGKETLAKGTYLLKGWIYVADGSELTIEAP